MGVVAALRETVADRARWASASTAVVVALPGDAEAERTPRMLSDDDAELGRTDAGVAEDHAGAAPRAVARSGEEEAQEVGENLVTTGGEVEAEASVQRLVMTGGEEEAEAEAAGKRMATSGSAASRKLPVVARRLRSDEGPGEATRCPAYIADAASLAGGRRLEFKRSVVAQACQPLARGACLTLVDRAGGLAPDGQRRTGGGGAGALVRSGVGDAVCSAWAPSPAPPSSIAAHTALAPVPATASLSLPHSDGWPRRRQG